MKTNYLHNCINFSKILKWLAHTLELQLFLMLISLPILIGWGLPISAVSLFSTPLFAPLFTVFLFVSCLIFLTELLVLPNSLLITALEYLTKGLLAIIQHNSDVWLIGFCTPPEIFLFILPCMALAICIRYKKIGVRIALLATTLLLFCALLRFYQYACRKSVHYIPCHTASLYALPVDGTITLVDPGLLGKKPMSESWITYTLLPALAKETGATIIDTIVFLKLSQRALEALAILAQNMPIKGVMLPRYTGRLHKNTWLLMMKCKKMVTEKGGTWTTVQNRPVSLYITNAATITVHASEEEIAYHDATYHPLFVIHKDASGTIQELQVTSRIKK